MGFQYSSPYGPSGSWTTDYAVDFTTMTTATLQSSFSQGWYNESWTNSGSGGGSAPNSYNDFSPSCIALESDGLHLSMELGGQGYGGVQTCGIVTTAAHYAFPAPTASTNVCIQMVAELSVGQGTWPTLWFLSTDNGPAPPSGTTAHWPPEGDCLEFNPPQAHVQLGGGYANEANNYTGSPGTITGFHCWTWEWGLNQLTTYMDGVECATAAIPGSGTYTGTTPITAGWWYGSPYYLLFTSGSTTDGITSVPTDYVIASLQVFLTATNSVPSNVALPAISGGVAQNDILSATTGTWNGTPTPTYGYQWNRSGSAISGATSSTYTLQAADVGHTITVTVTATNSHGSASATSTATATITGTNNVLAVNYLANGTSAAEYAAHTSVSATVCGATKIALVNFPGDVGCGYDVTAANQPWPSSITGPDWTQWGEANPAGQTYDWNGHDGGVNIDALFKDAATAGTPVILSAYRAPNWASVDDTGKALGDGNYGIGWNLPEYDAWFASEIVYACKTYPAIKAVIVGNEFKGLDYSSTADGTTDWDWVRYTNTYNAIVAALDAAGLGSILVGGPYLFNTNTGVSWSNSGWPGYSSPLVSTFTAPNGYSLRPSDCYCIQYFLTHATRVDILSLECTVSTSPGPGVAGMQAYFTYWGNQAVAAGHTIKALQMAEFYSSSHDAATVATYLNALSGAAAALGSGVVALFDFWNDGTVNNPGWTISSGGTLTDVGADLSTYFSSGNSQAAFPSPDSGSGTAPSVVNDPTISGTTVEGDVLTATTGTWNGTATITYAYQWNRVTTGGSSAISGATSSTYTLQAADVGDTITVTVTATNGYGNASATSNPTGTITTPNLSNIPSAPACGWSAVAAQGYGSSSLVAAEDGFDLPAGVNSGDYTNLSPLFGQGNYLEGTNNPAGNSYSTNESSGGWPGIYVASAISFSNSIISLTTQAGSVTQTDKGGSTWTYTNTMGGIASMPSSLAGGSGTGIGSAGGGLAGGLAINIKESGGFLVEIKAAFPAPDQHSWAAFWGKCDQVGGVTWAREMDFWEAVTNVTYNGTNYTYGPQTTKHFPQSEGGSPSYGTQTMGGWGINGGSTCPAPGAWHTYTYLVGPNGEMTQWVDGDPLYPTETFYALQINGGSWTDVSNTPTSNGIWNLPVDSHDSGGGLDIPFFFMLQSDLHSGSYTLTTPLVLQCDYFKVWLPESNTTMAGVTGGGIAPNTAALGSGGTQNTATQTGVAHIVTGTTATMGNTTTTGATGSTAGSGYQWGSIFAAPLSGTASSFSVYCAGGSSAQSFVPALYAVSGGLPTTRLATGTAFTVAAGQAAGWVTAAMPSTAIAGGTSYMLAIESGTTANEALIYSLNVTNGGYWFQPNSYPTPPASWGATNAENNEWCFYLTFVPTVRTATQTGQTRVRSTATHTQSAVARISIPGSKTQPAIARIGHGYTQPAKARIKAFPTATQPAIAHIGSGVQLIQSVNLGNIIPGGSMGNTTPGGQSSTPGNQIQFGSVVTAGSTVTTQTFEMYCSGGSNAQSFIPALYHVSGGNPTTLIASGTEFTVAAGQALGWATTPFAVALTAGTQYMLCVLALTTDSSAHVYNTAESSNSAFYFGAGQNTPPSSWGGLNATEQLWNFALTWPQTQGSANQYQPVLASGVNAGDWLTVLAWVGQSATSISSISGGGCTWSQVTRQTAYGDLEMWVGKNSSGTTGATTLTVNLSAVDTAQVQVNEWAGIGAVGPTLLNSGSGTTAAIGSLVTNEPSQLAVGMVISANSMTSISWPQNTLSQADASFESPPGVANVGDWLAGGNTTITTTSAAGAHQGSYAMSMNGTTTQVTGITAYTPPTLTVAVTPGQTYTFCAWFKAAATGRNVYVTVGTNNSTGQAFWTGNTVTDTTTGWTQATVTFTAPTGATLANQFAVYAQNTTAGEVHYVDDCWFGPGTAPPPLIVLSEGSATTNGPVTQPSFYGVAITSGTQVGSLNACSFASGSWASAVMLLTPVRTPGATQLAIARISHPLTTATQAAKAHIVTTFANSTTQTAAADIRNTATKTQPAVTRVALLRTATQSGVMRVQAVGRTFTQSAAVDIKQPATTFTQSGVMRVQDVGRTHTQSAILRVQDVGKTLTQSGVTRVQTVGRAATQVAKARVQAAPTATQPAIVRVNHIGLTHTQSAVLRVQILGTHTQSAVQRTQVTGLYTQPAITRVQDSRTSTQPAVVRVTKARSITQSAIQRTQIYGMVTQSATSHVLVPHSYTQTGISRIQAVARTTTQGAKANIVTTSQRVYSQLGVTRIQQPAATHTQAGVMRVEGVGLTRVQPAILRIQATPTKTQPATVRVQVGGTFTQAGKARIQAVALAAAQAAMARVVEQRTLTQAAVTRVGATRMTSQAAVANLRATATPKTQTATARVAVSAQTTQSAVSRIAQLPPKTITGITRVAVSGLYPQAALARMSVSRSFTQAAVLRVQRVALTVTQPAILRVAIVGTKAQPAVTRVAAARTKVQPAVTRVDTAGLTNTIRGQTAVLVPFPKVYQEGISRIQQIFDKTTPGVARISNAALTYSITATAFLLAAPTLRSVSSGPQPTSNRAVYAGPDPYAYR